MLFEELPPELIELIAWFGGPKIYINILTISKKIDLWKYSEKDRKLWQKRFGYKKVENGSYEWTVNGLRHSQWNQPAFICKHGTKFWYYKGKLHRDYGCAIECKHGGKWEFKDGKHKKTIKKCVCGCMGWVCSVWCGGVCVCGRCGASVGYSV